MTLKIQREIELDMPMMPNYLIIAAPPGKRQDGIQERPKIDVSELNDSQIEIFTTAWAAAFREHVHSRRNQPEAAKERA